MTIQIPVSHASEVTAVRFFRDQIKMIEDVFDVVPVLHQQSVGLINDNHFYGREEIVVALLITAGRQTETEWK